MEPKFYYRLQKTPLLVPTLSQIHPVHTFTPYFPKIHPYLSIYA